MPELSPPHSGVCFTTELDMGRTPKSRRRPSIPRISQDPPRRRWGSAIRAASDQGMSSHYRKMGITPECHYQYRQRRDVTDMTRQQHDTSSHPLFRSCSLEPHEFASHKGSCIVCRLRRTHYKAALKRETPKRLSLWDIGRKS